MSEIKLISPLLDDFIIGDVFSEHNGVRCVPAMKNNSDTRYIVKIISIPASQVQVQAFLLTGIYRDTESAQQYFAELVAGVEKELSILSQLAKLEGFLDYEGYQVVQKENETGFDVYLLGTYKRSLERHFRKYPMTHLAAVNLGLDTCAAMAVCRNAGFLCCDLKPGNIFIGDDNEYRIGDIGFLPMNGLRFASLHDRYRSPYTAPELQDPLAPISESTDIYAAGLILYQAYNGGALPFDGMAPNEVLQPPLYADYEMSEIILKACSPDPAERWENPIKMGQAIVSYMQRNGANDTPIAPPIVRDEPEPAQKQAVEETQPATETTLDEELGAYLATDGESETDLEALLAYVTEEETASEPEQPTEVVEEQPEIAEEIVQEPPVEAVIAEKVEIEPTEEVIEDAQEISLDALIADVQAAVEEPVEKADENEQLVMDDAIILPDLPDAEAQTEQDESVIIPTDLGADSESEEDIGSLAFIDATADDETVPAEDMAENIAYSELTDDVNDILAQVDDLIAHEPPSPAVAPEPVELAIPEPITEEAQSADTEDKEASDDLSQTVAAISMVVESSENALETQINTEIELPADENAEVEVEEPVEEETEEEFIDDEFLDESTEKRNSGIGSKMLIAFLVFVIIACIGVGGFLFYKNFYMKTIDKLNIRGVDNQMTVSVLTDADPQLLTVVCTDTYGNKQTAPLLGGTATFTDLAPDTLYKVTLEISGFHGLKGETKGSYTTAPQTEIMSFSAITGADAGTAILNFTVKGFDSESWTVTYSTPSEQEQSQTFSGHSTTISGLTLDATYTFTLDSSSNVYVFGQNVLDYTAGALIYPQDLNVTSFTQDGIVVEWNTPEGVTVPQWTAMCYNDSGYSQNFTISENTVTFTDVDPNGSYTIEVTASGMSVGERFFLSKNTVAITDFTATVDGKFLNISWNYSGTEPAANWILTYVFEDAEEEIAVAVNGTTAQIENVVPKGNYLFKIRLGDGTTVLNNEQPVTVEAAANFQKFGVSSNNLDFAMCVPPDTEDWIWWGAKVRTNEFTVGQKGGFVMYINSYYQYVEETVTIMCVVRDKDGKLLSVSTTDDVWTKMWVQSYGEITLTNMPQEAGEYSVELYFDSTFVHEQTFTIS